jgi:2-polyprenyl-6-hydroxyphenyl methylase / 3-demethylubiquinone-9 3-methyltransferase
MKTTNATSPPPQTSGTIDSDEIAKFEKMAEDWWDPDGPFKPLHALNPVRLRFIRDQIVVHFKLDEPMKPLPLSGLRVLDIGCGGGLLCEPMARLGATVTGVDAAARNIDIARTHAEGMGLQIDYRCAAAEDLVQEGLAYDIVLNMEVVEHVADVDLFLGTAANLIRPDGLMVVATMNRTAKAYALAIIGAEHIMRWLPVGTHDWRKFIKPSEMARYLRIAGMRIEAMTGLVYNPFTSGWSLNERDLNVNYMATAIRNR